MNPLAWFSGYKSVLAGVGMIGLGIYQMTQGQIEQGIASLTQGLAVIGLRGALVK